MLTEQNRAWRIILGISEQNQVPFPFPFPAGLNGDAGFPAKNHAVGMESVARCYPLPVSISVAHCPECGGRAVRIGYCFTCPLCGWGACG